MTLNGNKQATIHYKTDSERTYIYIYIPGHSVTSGFVFRYGQSVYPAWGHLKIVLIVRVKYPSITHSLKRWASTKSPISQLLVLIAVFFFFSVHKNIQGCRVTRCTLVRVCILIKKAFFAKWPPEEKDYTYCGNPLHIFLSVALAVKALRLTALMRTPSLRTRRTWCSCNTLSLVHIYFAPGTIV